MKMMLSAAPKAAPCDTPRKPGSTMGFWKSICSTSPQAARAIPKSAAMSRRGIRSEKTSFCARLSFNNRLSGIQ